MYHTSLDCNVLHLAMSCTTLVCSEVCSGAEMRSKYYLGYFHRRGQFWSFPRVARVGALGAEKFVSRNPSFAHYGTKIQTFLGLPPTICSKGQSTHISLVLATTQIKESRICKMRGGWVKLKREMSKKTSSQNCVSRNPAENPIQTQSEQKKCWGNSYPIWNGPDYRKHFISCHILGIWWYILIKFISSVKL